MDSLSPRTIAVGLEYWLGGALDHGGGGPAFLLSFFLRCPNPLRLGTKKSGAGVDPLVERSAGS